MLKTMGTRRIKYIENPKLFPSKITQIKECSMISPNAIQEKRAVYFWIRKLPIMYAIILTRLKISNGVI